MRNYFIVEKKHHAYRQCRKDKSLLAEEFSEKKLPPLQRAVERVRYILGQERPVVFPDEKIALMFAKNIQKSINTVKEIYLALFEN